ncbi:hypothetical protein DN797_25770 [Escherichia coli]|uniref:EspG domain-containing protein n=1 Tax=Escherichia coli TaxID=562 RepID=UPI0019C57204|nr:hypothetical protein [Escherichia coli]EHW3230786.1 hypothetical protein [Escherichia coli]EIP9765925.1 hypothetical protein [Escherichia coli]EJF8019505.1 hypothetical protein [Escherichia coli]EJI6629891.1 hypothetical protein [Escherichia coli]
MINGLNNTNSAASIVLDAANKVNNGFTKSWNDMSCAEKLLKILSLGLWSPKYSPSEKLSINGVDIPGEAQETLRNALGLRSTNSSPAQYVVKNGISRHYAEMVAQNSSGTDAQKDQLVDFLCQPGAATAICSAFYQSFNVPSLTLTHTRVAQASQLNAGNSQPLPNACLNISLSQTPGGDIYVASHTGVQIMAPEDRPNELGMLTNRTTYSVPKDLKCKINDMVSAIKPQYAASETYP